jgi:ATP-dependent DNA helicase RecG
MDMELKKINVSAEKEKQFNAKKIFTAEDLVEYFPRKYYDFRKLTPIRDAEDGDVCAVRGVVIDRYSGPSTYSVKIADENNNRLTIRWFGSSYYFNQIAEEMEYTFCGKITRSEQGFKIMNSPYAFSMTHREVAKIMPVYSKIPGMSNDYLVSHIRNAITMLALEDHGDVEKHAQKRKMVDWATAYAQIHAPKNEEAYKQARRRIAYNSLYHFYKEMDEKANVSVNSLFQLKSTKLADSYIDSLPFSVTGSQQKAIDNLKEVFSGTNQVDTLIFGDVGSGKTLVAFWAMLAAKEAGVQAALMCPTQVLAEQHYNDLKKVAKNLGCTISYLASGIPKKEREKILKGLGDGSIDFIVGTHSVISDDVKMKALGLAIVDEEHKFGVEQKEKIREKAKTGVHYIAMSATPIPRSLALSLFNKKTNVILMDELPKGRKHIITRTTDQSNLVYNFMLKHIKKGRQAYVICPLIENSETGLFEDVESVHEAYEELRTYFKDVPDVKISFITGNMSKKKISEEVTKYKNGETNVLISTTIVEVGVNVPTANIIVIKSAERFGLAQLHQLRGRVGRSDIQSYCVLLTSKPDDKLDIMCKTANGFEVAEEDMRMRGAGKLNGLQQSGYSKEVELIIKYPKLARMAMADAGMD